MATDDPNAPASEEYDSDQTLFFKRRNQHPNLLPIAVAGLLVLASGALITWGFTRSGKKPADEAIAGQTQAEAAPARTLISTAEAKSVDNPPVGPAQELAGSEPALKAAASTTPGANRAAASKPAPVPAAAVATVAAANQPPSPEASAPLNFDVSDPTNAAVRTQVLERIDLMPNITPLSKDKLYASVDHARKMGRVLTFQFAKGETTVHPADVDHLKQQVQTPEVKQLLEDPTVVFVVLGYADPKGSEKVNAEISNSRAHSVMDALRDKCGFQNVMHSVAMGGSTLFSTQDAEKNRVVELWAVVP